MAESEQGDLTTLTVTLLSAYVSNNMVPSGDLAGLIQSTHKALSGINAPSAELPAEPEHVAKVSVRKSLGSRDHILSLIDGKPYKTLKRHLSRHGLTPAEYRARYNLAADYPMVAPAYSEQRRAVAEKLGLGRKRAAVATKPAKVVPANAAPSVPAPTPKKRAAAKGNGRIPKPVASKAEAVSVPAKTAAKPGRPKAAKASVAKKAPSAAVKPKAAAAKKPRAARKKTSVVSAGGAV